MSVATKNSVIQHTALLITCVFSIVMLNIINLGKKRNHVNNSLFFENKTIHLFSKMLKVHTSQGSLRGLSLTIFPW